MTSRITLTNTLICILTLLVTTKAYSQEIYIQDGIGLSINREKACDKAMLYAKKEALDSAGTIVESSFHINEELSGNKFSSAASSDIKQLSRGKIKVIDKTVTIRMEPNGKFTCHITAKFSVDSLEISKHNKQYQGQLPNWAVYPPRILARTVTIADAKTLDGALAFALFKQLYEAGINDPATNFNINNFRMNEPKILKVVRNINLSKNIQLSSMIKWSQSNEIDGITKVDVVRLKYENGQLKRTIGFFHETQPSVGFNVIEQTRIDAETAQIEDVISSLESLGVSIKYEKVVNGDVVRWYVMTIAKPESFET